MEAEARILDELEQLRQLFSDMSKHVSDIRKKTVTQSGLIVERTEEFEQLNGRVGRLLEQISQYADALKDILGYKVPVEALMGKVHKIDEYEQRHDELESTFQKLSEKINGRIDEIESKLLNFEVSCEEDLTAMNDHLSRINETKNSVTEQIHVVEEQLATSTGNLSELENRQHKLEDSQISEKIEKIDSFMAQKTAIGQLLSQNNLAIDRQVSEARNIQETLSRFEDRLRTIVDRSDHLTAYVAEKQEEYDRIREKIDKTIDEFSQYNDSQREQAQAAGEDFNQRLKTSEQAYQKQIKVLSSGEMDRLKSEINVCENDAMKQFAQIKSELEELLENGKAMVSNQLQSSTQEIEAMKERAKNDMANNLAEFEKAYHKQIKEQEIMVANKETLDKNLKVNKWMMIINITVMGLTLTVLFLTVLF